MNRVKKPINSSELDKSIKELVIFRLRAVPKTLHISIGSQDYSTEELIKNVNNDSELGQQIIEMQLDYLRDLASGKISKLLSDE